MIFCRTISQGLGSWAMPQGQCNIPKQRLSGDERAESETGRESRKRKTDRGRRKKRSGLKGSGGKDTMLSSRWLFCPTSPMFPFPCSLVQSLCYFVYTLADPIRSRRREAKDNDVLQQAKRILLNPPKSKEGWSTSGVSHWGLRSSWGNWLHRHAPRYDNYNQSKQDRVILVSGSCLQWYHWSIMA